MTVAGLYAIKYPEQVRMFLPKWGRDVGPVSLPEVGGTDPSSPYLVRPDPQGDSMILQNRPMYWSPAVAVTTEPAKAQRNPLYPDDLRAYDTARSRQQDVLTDTSVRNYQIDSHLQPYSVQNATRQEASQSATLSGRVHTPYTSGGTEKNGVIDLVERGAQVTRGSSSTPERPNTTVWLKNQRFNPSTIPPPNVQRAAIENNREYQQSAKYSDVPRYLNSTANQTSFSQNASTLTARQQVAAIEHINTMYEKQLLLRTDDGIRTDVSKPGVVLGRPITNRRRGIQPSSSNGGLVYGGTGRTFLDDNHLQQLQPRQFSGPSGLTNVQQASSKLGHNALQWTQFIDPGITEKYKPNTVFSAYVAKGDPISSSDRAHNIVDVLKR